MGSGLGRDLVEVATLLISLTLISMLVNNAQGTSQVVKTTGDTFGGLLKVASFQGGSNQFSTAMFG
jgi:hypothetical protein